MSIVISVKDCKYYLDYDRISDYPFQGDGDCDHIANNKGCHPNNCPINRAKELPNLAGLHRAKGDTLYLQQVIEMLIDFQSSASTVRNQDE